jgi:MFS family permease
MPLVRTPELYVALVVGYHGIASVASLGYAQVMRTVYPEDARARIMALVRVGMGLAWIAASLLGGPLMQVVPFQWVFAAAGVFGIAGPLVFRRIRLAGPVEAAEPVALAGIRATLRENVAFRRFLIAFFTFGFGAWLIGPAIPILLVDVLRATNFQVGLLGALTAATSVIAYYQWGIMIDRRRPAGALVLAFLVGTATSLIYLVAFSTWAVMFAGITDGFASAGIELGWLTAVLQFAPAGQVAHYVAIFNTLLGVRATIAPLLAGVLIPHVGVRPIFAAGALLALGASVMMWRIRGGRSSRPNEGSP